MHPAWRQDCDGVNVLSREKIFDIVLGGHVKFRRYGISARTNRVADGGKLGPLDMTAAQQLRMTLCNTSAPKQSESDHQGFLAKSADLVRKIRALTKQIQYRLVFHMNESRCRASRLEHFRDCAVPISHRILNQGSPSASQPLLIGERDVGQRQSRDRPSIIEAT